MGPLLFQMDDRTARSASCGRLVHHYRGSKARATDADRVRSSGGTDRRLRKSSCTSEPIGRTHRAIVSVQVEGRALVSS